MPRANISKAMISSQPQGGGNKKQGLVSLIGKNQWVHFKIASNCTLIKSTTNIRDFIYGVIYLFNQVILLKYNDSGVVLWTNVLRSEAFNSMSQVVTPTGLYLSGLSLGNITMNHTLDNSNNLETLVGDTTEETPYGFVLQFNLDGIFILSTKIDGSFSPTNPFASLSTQNKYALAVTNDTIHVCFPTMTVSNLFSIQETTTNANQSGVVALTTNEQDELIYCKDYQIYYLDNSVTLNSNIRILKVITDNTNIYILYRNTTNSTQRFIQKYNSALESQWTLTITTTNADMVISGSDMYLSYYSTNIVTNITTTKRSIVDGSVLWSVSHPVNVAAVLKNVFYANHKIYVLTYDILSGDDIVKVVIYQAEDGNLISITNIENLADIVQYNSQLSVEFA